MKFSRMEKMIIIVIISLGLFLGLVFNRTKYLGPLELPEPEQVMLRLSKEIVVEGKKGPVTLEKVATYKVKAGVRGRKNYRLDSLTKISPMDLVLAWGNLNQLDSVNSVSYRQLGRCYIYEINGNSRITKSYVEEHSSNTHIIPADERVLRSLKRIRKNHYVELEGYLVNVYFGEGVSYIWLTSLSRTDTGSGSCEIFYVTRVRVYR